MAFTYALGSARANSTANPVTFSYTVAVGDSVIALLIKADGATNRAGGSPTWGSYAFTQANSTQKAVTSPEASAELWYILNPLPGTATLTIPNTGGIEIWHVVGIGRATRGGSAGFIGANGGNATSTNPTPGAVTVNNAASIGFATTAGGWTNFSSATPVGTAIHTSDDGQDGGGGQYVLNPAIGSHTLSWTFGTSDDWGAVSAYFYEIPPNVMENYKGVECISAGVISVGENMK